MGDTKRVSEAGDDGAETLADERSRVALLRPREEWALAAPGRERDVLLDIRGRVITRKEGDQGSVLWTAEALRPLIGQVHLITLNHRHGSSLGPEAVAIAVGLRAGEVNAVTADARFRMYRRDRHWPPSERLGDAITAGERHLAGQMQRMRDAGRITDDDINRTFYHVLWQRVMPQFLAWVDYQVEARHT